MEQNTTVKDLVIDLDARDASLDGRLASTDFANPEALYQAIRLLGKDTCRLLSGDREPHQVKLVSIEYEPKPKGCRVTCGNETVYGTLIYKVETVSAWQPNVPGMIISRKFDVLSRRGFSAPEPGSLPHVLYTA